MNKEFIDNIKKSDLTIFGVDSKNEHDFISFIIGIIPDNEYYEIDDFSDFNRLNIEQDKKIIIKFNRLSNDIIRREQINFKNTILIINTYYNINTKQQQIPRRLLYSATLVYTLNNNILTCNKNRYGHTKEIIINLKKELRLSKINKLINKL